MNLVKPFLLFIFLYLLTLSSVQAQNQRIDSLQLSVKYADNPKQKIHLLFQLAEEYKNKQPDIAFQYAQKALQISKEIDKADLSLKAQLLLSELSSSLTNFKSALIYANQSLELAEKLKLTKELSQAYELKGLVFSDLGDYSKSTEFYFKSLDLYEQINDKNGIANAFRRIASVYYDQLNYEKALEYYFKALNMAKEINNQEGIASGLNDIAAVYGNMRQYEKVIKYLEDAVLINKKLGNKRAEGINYTNLGLINQRLENYENAFDYFNKAIHIFQDLKHPALIANAQVVLGAYYFDIQNLDLSIQYAKQAYELAKKYSLKKTAYDATGVIYQSYLQKNDSLLADKYLIINFQMKDSLDIESSAAQLSKREFKYEIEKEKQAAELKQQRHDFIQIIIIITLTLGLGIVILIFARQKIKAKNTELEKTNLEIELDFKNKELALKVMSLLKKNEVLTEISKKLIAVKNDAVKDETKQAINRIYKELQKSTDDEIWEEFELRFKQVHSEFYQKLMKQFPDLTPSEQRLCAFLRLNMSSKEISELTGQSLNALETARYRLRKKLGISNSQVNLISFLSQI
jgi:tetratricopeptide (TPR) repeat protein